MTVEDNGNGADDKEETAVSDEEALIDLGCRVSPSRLRYREWSSVCVQFSFPSVWSPIQ